MGDVIPTRGTLKTAKFTIETGSDGYGEVFIEVPAGGRVVEGGVGRFTNPQLGDSIISIEVWDETKTTELDSFEDEEVPEANRGWFILETSLKLSALTDFRLIPGGKFIKVKVKKASAVVETFYGNLIWGKP